MNDFCPRCGQPYGQDGRWPSEDGIDVCYWPCWSDEIDREWWQMMIALSAVELEDF